MRTTIPDRVRVGLNRVGEVYCPGFQELGCVDQAARVLDFLPPGDRNGLEILLTLLGWMPVGVTRWIVSWIEDPRWTDWDRPLNFWEAPLAPGMRMLQLGLKGLAVSLYYGDPRVQHRLGFNVTVDDSGLNPE